MIHVYCPCGAEIDVSIIWREYQCHAALAYARSTAIRKCPDDLPEVQTPERSVAYPQAAARPVLTTRLGHLHPLARLAAGGGYTADSTDLGDTGSPLPVHTLNRLLEVCK